MDNFIFGDVYHLNDVLTDRQRELITLVVLTANQDMSGISEHTKSVPLEPQATVNEKTRYNNGLEIQVNIK